MHALSGKSSHVPLAGPLDVLDNNFKRVKIEGGNGIEANVENDQRPLKEGIRRISCREESPSQRRATLSLKGNLDAYHPQRGGPCAG